MTSRSLIRMRAHQATFTIWSAHRATEAASSEPKPSASFRLLEASRRTVQMALSCKTVLLAGRGTAPQPVCVVQTAQPRTRLVMARGAKEDAVKALEQQAQEVRTAIGGPSNSQVTVTPLSVSTATTQSTASVMGSVDGVHLMSLDKDTFW